MELVATVAYELRAVGLAGSVALDSVELPPDPVERKSVAAVQANGVPDVLTAAEGVTVRPTTEGVIITNVATAAAHRCGVRRLQILVNGSSRASTEVTGTAATIPEDDDPLPRQHP